MYYNDTAIKTKYTLNQYFVSFSFLVFRVSTRQILFGLASFQSFKQN
jgi:hypothetical protein